jgi:hypothetical protein
LRERRRGGLPVAYAGEFSLTEEVVRIAGPLARRASRLPNPQVVNGRVTELVDAVHELVSAVVGWLAEIDGRREHAQRLAALDSADRARAVRRLVDLAPRPPLPVVGAEEIASGQWATALVEIAEPCDGPLAALLARSLPPGAVDLRRLDSRSEKLVGLLREVDAAARQLEIATGKAEAAAAKRKTTRQQDRAEAAREELRALGIEVVA